jgi:hypothetical protein
MAGPTSDRRADGTRHHREEFLVARSHGRSAGAYKDVRAVDAADATGLFRKVAKLVSLVCSKESVERRWVMQPVISILAVASAVAATVLAVQQKPGPAVASHVLTAVQITHSVLANGNPLPAGLYEVRLTNDRPTPLPGQSADAERWVEFVANGVVVAREVAVILRDDDLPSVGASSAPTPEGSRVDMLKGGEFLRISVKRGNERYLVYLPAAP